MEMETLPIKKPRASVANFTCLCAEENSSFENLKNFGFAYGTYIILNWKSAHVLIKPFPFAGLCMFLQK